jgi:hypothetical protein|tara:strand:- start:134 stop:325 length:192 start_codon:yes stop_codon:yes gene_type:complete
MFKDIVFSKSDFDGKAEGGIFFRSFELNKFLEKVEASDEEVVGLRFEGNNVEILVNKNKRMSV